MYTYCILLDLIHKISTILLLRSYVVPAHAGAHAAAIPMLFCATLCSSFCANIVANPFDVVKSRMQNMPVRVDGTAAYSSMADCFVKSVHSQGPAVLYSGFVPAFVKLAPYTVISLTVADKLTQALTGKSAL